MASLVFLYQIINSIKKTQRAVFLLLYRTLNGAIIVALLLLLYTERREVERYRIRVCPNVLFFKPTIRLQLKSRKRLIKATRLSLSEVCITKWRLRNSPINEGRRVFKKANKLADNNIGIKSSHNIIVTALVRITILLFRCYEANRGRFANVSGCVIETLRKMEQPRQCRSSAYYLINLWS